VIFEAPAWGHSWELRDEVSLSSEPSLAEMAFLMPEERNVPPSKSKKKKLCMRLQHKKEQERQDQFFSIARYGLGFTSPNPRTPYLKLVTREGLQCLFLKYRQAASMMEDLKPHLVMTTTLGTFVLDAPQEVLHHLLEFIPEEGMGTKEELGKIEKQVYGRTSWGGDRYRSPKTLDVGLWSYSDPCVFTMVYYKSTIGPIIY
jgi:hypothetical protein